MKYFALVSLGFVFIFSSCIKFGKYDEGPALSLRTKKNRLTANWKLNRYYKDGYVQDYTTFELLLTKKDAFHFGLAAAPPGLVYDFKSDSSGVWELTNDKTTLRLRHFDNETKEEYKMVDWKILKLTKSTLFLSREKKDTLIRMELESLGDAESYNVIKTN